MYTNPYRWDFHIPFWESFRDVFYKNVWVFIFFSFWNSKRFFIWQLGMYSTGFLLLKFQIHICKMKYVNFNSQTVCITHIFPHILSLWSNRSNGYLSVRLFSLNSIFLLFYFIPLVISLRRCVCVCVSKRFPFDISNLWSWFGDV